MLTQIISMLSKSVSQQGAETCSLALAAVMPGINLRTHEGSDKSRVWSTVDYAGEEARNELFCIRFGSVESELRAA